MDVMEPSSDLFHGLPSNPLLDNGGFCDDNKDSLLDLLSHSFPDMLLQPYGHLSSLPLDTPDLQLGIHDYDLQEYDSADDSILEEFVCEVQNILSDPKRSNVANSLDIGDGLSTIAPLPAIEDPFSPVKKLCPDQLDLLMGPLLDGDEEDDFKIKNGPLESCQPEPVEPSPLSSPVTQKLNANNLTEGSSIPKKPMVKAAPGGKPAVALIKPLINTSLASKPVPVGCKQIVSIIKSDRKGVQKPAVASVKPIVKVVKVEDESSDEVDIETVDDDELNGLSGAEVLSAKLADMECQAARVSVIPSQFLPKSKPCPTVFPAQADKCQKVGADQSLPAKNVSAVPSFPPVVKPSPKPKDKEQSPSSVVEKIKQSVVAPRSSILIPHQGSPQLRGKAVKQESGKAVNKVVNEEPSSPQPYDARTLDHDYCTTALNEPVAYSPATPVKTEQDFWVVSTSDLSVAEESVVVSLENDVPMFKTGSRSDIVKDNSKLTETKVGRGVSPLVSRQVEEDEAATATIAKPERELPLSYRKWHHSRSRSPSPYSQSKKRGSRRRSSCSPSSVSSQSMYRSRSRSSSHGRKSRLQSHHRRKHSRGQRQRSRQGSKRSRYNYSRSSSRSSYSSRSCSRSSRSRSRSPTRSRSRSRSRSHSWDYKRNYNRNPVTSYGWSQDKRPLFDEKTQQIEERRVVYVGRLPDGTTKNDLRHRFGCFGPIQEVSIHFRNSGHNYGFVTFSYKRDAYEAVEHGNDDPNQPKFDLSFGGRRQFCRQRYADLDSQYNHYAAQRPPPSNDFDSLLRAAKLKLKKY